MGLYLCVFDGEDEVDGVEVGSYREYDDFRELVVNRLEDGSAGSRFPVFVLHSDCEGEWSVEECLALRRELAQIELELTSLPAIGFSGEWQRKVARSLGLQPRNALESFIDVDGELLVERLRSLVEAALARQLPILFQ